MAVLTMKAIEKMDTKARDAKLKELRLELVRGNVAANRQNAKTKEIKKAIARILTFNRRETSEVVK